MTGIANPCRLDATGMLRPCGALDDCLQIDGAGTRYQGVKLQTMINMDTKKFARHLVTLKSGKHSKKGIVFNLCPFCGGELVAGAKEILERINIKEPT